MEDIALIAPYKDSVDVVELLGIHVKELFEDSVRDYNLTSTASNPNPKFLQVSG